MQQVESSLVPKYWFSILLMSCLANYATSIIKLLDHCSVGKRSE